MIIGLSGYAGTGKDTVAKIIQYINCKNTGAVTLEEVVNNREHTWWLEEQSGWEIKKFAGPLKKVASILTGIPEEKFEDREFKESYLGPQWDKEIYYEHFDDIVDDRYSVREFLQRLGTDAIRQNLHPNAWVNALMAEYRPYSARGSSYEEVESKWVISDVRFYNEAQAIIDRGGVVIRIDRPGFIPINNHPSEIELDGWDFHYRILNASDLVSLKATVEVVLNKIHANP